MPQTRPARTARPPPFAPDPVARILPVDAPDDPRLAAFVGFRRRRPGRTRLLETRRVVERAARAGLRVHAAVATGPHARALEAHLPGDTPIYVASHGVLSALAGFAFHRGCAALVDVPGPEPFDPARLDRPAAAAIGLADPVNLGAIARTAAALGFETLLVDERGADPYEPRALRVSAGALFHLHVVEMPRPEHDLAALAARGARVVAVETGGRRLETIPHDPPVDVLVVGGEDRGLPGPILGLCTDVATVPMAREGLSLNVHAAFAVAGHALVAAHGPPP